MPAVRKKGAHGYPPIYDAHEHCPALMSHHTPAPGVVNPGLRLLQALKAWRISQVEFELEVRDIQYKLIEGIGQAIQLVLADPDRYQHMYQNASGADREEPGREVKARKLLAMSEGLGA